MPRSRSALPTVVMAVARLNARSSMIRRRAPDLPEQHRRTIGGRSERREEATGIRARGSPRGAHAIEHAVGPNARSRSRRLSIEIRSSSVLLGRKPRTGRSRSQAGTPASPADAASGVDAALSEHDARSPGSRSKPAASQEGHHLRGDCEGAAGGRNRRSGNAMRAGRHGDRRGAGGRGVRRDTARTKGLAQGNRPARGAQLLAERLPSESAGNSGQGAWPSGRRPSRARCPLTPRRCRRRGRRPARGGRPKSPNRRPVALRGRRAHVAVWKAARPSTRMLPRAEQVC